MKCNIITKKEMLAISANEISELGRLEPNPLVSVIVVTYNHEKYIAEAIEGILAQQCDFPIELIIGEDCSTDRTLEICLDYQKKHPEILRVITWQKNLGVGLNYLRCFGRAQGKYIALCEGDDYWIDPEKLSKQVSLMEKYPDTTLCGARTRILSEIPGEKRQGSFIGPKKNLTTYTLKDVMKTYVCHTSTFMLRKSELKITEHFKSMWYPDGYLQSLSTLSGSLRCLPDVVSVWRHHPMGVCIGNSPYLHYDRNISICESLLDIVDSSDAYYVKNSIDLLLYKKCHQWINDGRIFEARQITPSLLKRLVKHNQLKAFILFFHVYLPKHYKILKKIKDKITELYIKNIFNFQK